MTSAKSRLVAVVLGSALLVAIAGPAPAQPGRHAEPVGLPEVCFAPDADQGVVEAYAQALGGAAARMSLGVPLAQIPDSNRWSYTASNGWGLQQGDPTTLTWSIVPDGTPIAGAIGEPAGPSNLRAYLDGIYGSPAVWLPIFQQVFDRWSEITGVSYVYQPSDDGVAMFNYAGVLGVRGDVRIGGHAIDGNSNVLAYNFYPNNGDMVLDTADSFFTVIGGGSLRLRNTVAHEHGHGLGFRHSCPINQTKLMEPFLSTKFDGPQHDEILGGNRAYGDDLETNDLPPNASNLGALGNVTVNLAGLSADDELDVDSFKFRVGPGKKVTLGATPVGHTYLQGPQNSNGSCTTGSSFDSLTQSDLSLEVIDVDGASVLGAANASPAGAAEMLAGVALPSGSGTYYARVRGLGDAAQMYDLALTVADVVPPADPIFADGFDVPGLGAWSASATGGGDLYASTSAAMTGARGLEAVIDDTARLFVQDDTPDAESRYRARFWLDPNGFSPGSGRDRATLFLAYSEYPKTKKLLQLLVRRKSGQYRLMVKVRLDGGKRRRTPWIPFPDAPTAIEIDWRRAAAPEADDGHLELWVGGTSVAKLEGLDNDSRFLDSLRLGAVKVRAAASGRVYFDGFESRRDSYIGP